MSAQQESEFAIDRNQSRIEGSVVKAREAKPMLGSRRSLGKSRHGLMWLATGKSGTLIPLTQHRKPYALRIAWRKNC
jgi:hypothetical protein